MIFIKGDLIQLSVNNEVRFNMKDLLENSKGKDIPLINNSSNTEAEIKEFFNDYKQDSNILPNSSGIPKDSNCSS